MRLNIDTNTQGHQLASGLEQIDILETVSVQVQSSDQTSHASTDDDNLWILGHSRGY